MHYFIFYNFFAGGFTTVKLLYDIGEFSLVSHIQDRRTPPLRRGSPHAPDAARKTQLYIMNPDRCSPWNIGDSWDVAGERFG